MSVDETRQYFQDPALWNRGPEPYQVQVQGDLARLLPPGTTTVLDAACGNGLVSKTVQTMARVVGADGSRAALRHFTGSACQCWLEALPFGDRAFDLVMANDVLEHLPPESIGCVRDELFRVAARHVLITVPFLENIEAGQQVCAACGAVTHRNRHERTHDLADLRALTPDGWQLALVVLSGAEWETDAELEGLRRAVGFAPPAPATCPRCGAAGGAALESPVLLQATQALLAGADLQAGAFVPCRTEAIACFHRTGESDPWTKLVAPRNEIERTINPMAIDLGTAGETLFRLAFLPSSAARAYYCAPGAVVSEQGLSLAADGPASDVKVGHFANAAGAWSVTGEADGPACVRIQFYHPGGYRFVANVDVDGPFELRQPEGPPPGPFGRLAALRVISGRVCLRSCRLDVAAAPQEFVRPGAGFLSLPDSDANLAVATGWYGPNVPHPAAIAAGVRARRHQLANLAAAHGEDPGTRRGALVDAIVARVAGAPAAGLTATLDALRELRGELRTAERTARDVTARCVELAAQVHATEQLLAESRMQGAAAAARGQALEAHLAATRAEVALATERLARLRYFEAGWNVVRHAARGIRRRLPRRPQVGSPSSPGWEPRSAVMLVPDDRIDRRVLLEARSLVQAGWRVRVVGAPAPTPGDRHDEEAFPEVEIVRVDAGRAAPIAADRQPPRLPPGERDWTDFYWLTNHYYLLATERPFQVVVAHDLPVLPAAAMAAARHGAWLAYDAHELYPEQHHFGPERSERYRRAETHLAPLADLAITVNESIAAEMARRYGIATPAVVLNCPELRQSLPLRKGDELRTALGIPTRQRILLFLGSLSLNRNLEAMVAAMAQVRNPDVALVLVGPGTEKRAELEAIARQHGVLGSSVFFHPAIPQADVLRFTAAADAGVIPYPHVDLNSRLCTPNKLFDFLVAGVPILANDSPELRRFVADAGTGMVWPFVNEAEIAKGIDAFFAQDHAAYRRRLAEVGARYTWQEEGKKVVALYEKLIAAGSPRAAGVS